MTRKRIAEPNPSSAWVAGAAAFVLLLAFVPGAIADATVSTSLPSGPPGAVGSDFQVRVQVSANDTGRIPISCSFRVLYPSNAVEFLSVTAGDLGQPSISAQAGTAPDVYRDIATVGNAMNVNVTPACLTLTFRVVSGSAGLYTISIADNPAGVPLLASDFQTSIPHHYDNSATTNLGEPPPPQPDPSLEFQFTDSNDSWNFVSAPPFDPPTATYLPAPDSALEMKATNNTNTFGYWEGPVIDLSPAGSLFTAEFYVKSSLADPSKTPQLRLRATSENLQQSRFMTLESRDDGFASPGPYGTTYTLILSPGIGAEQLRTEFELLNFDPLDDPAGDLQLERIIITRRDPADILGRQLVRTFDFNGITEAWTFHSTTAFSAPNFGISSTGLTLQGNGRTDTFGYWSSPELPGGVPTTAGAATTPTLPTQPIYIATFKVQSDVSSSEVDTVPQFRLRLNESLGRAASFMAIESKGSSYLSPVAGPSRSYVVYFVPPLSLADKPLIASFDYLNFDPADNSTATLTLDQMTLEVAPYPW